MEQLTIYEFAPSYRYIIDTSSMLTQKDNEPFRRKVHGRLWKYIDQLIQEHIIVTCSEIKEEIKDELILKWLYDTSCTILDIDDDIQLNVIAVVTTNPQLINFKKIKSSGDAFLIATAMKYSLTVITEENKRNNDRIPAVCNNLNIPCLNINELCEIEKWDL